MEYGLVAGWLVAYLVLGLAGLPLAARFLQRFPDRGAALSLPLSLAIIGLVTYWVGHLSLILGLAVGLVVLVGLSLLSLRGLDRTGFDARRMLGPAVVFAFAFLFMIAVRAVDPAVHPGGGEKFLDFGLLKSLLRTSRLPPEDFWFAGEPVRYYYGGHLIAALLAKLTFTEARYAYNLALAGFFGMLVTAAYGLAGAIAAERGRSTRTAGVFAAFFVGFASNLETPARALLWALPDGIARALAGWLGVEIEGLAASPAAFSYWGASRVIPGTVNEFPLFAWLNGDLHAHMMSTPFLLLMAALWFAYYRTPTDALGRRRALVFGVIPPLAGLLTVVNTWSFPTAVGIGWLTLTFADGDPAALLPRTIGSRFPLDAQSRLRHEVMRTVSALAVAAVVLVAGVVWSLPFWLGAASGRAIAFLPERSALGPLLLVHGAFLLVFVPYLLARARSLDMRTREPVLIAIIGLVALAWLFDAAALAVFGPLLLVGWLVLTKRRETDHQSGAAQSIAVRGSPAESDGGTVETQKRSSVPAVGFETVLLVAGVGLVLLVEFVYVKNNAAPGRFNTVFKTYAQVWILFGTAAGAIAAWLADARPSWSGTDGMGRHWRVAGRGLLALVVISTSIYGALALTDHFTNEGGVKRIDEPTLDALAFVSALHPAEDDAIEWLDNRTGQPNMVSVPGCWCNENATLTPYHWVNAPSSLTGIPTVAGWDHAGDYHGREAYLERVEDVETIYQGSPEETVRLLKQYNVEYIYVGPNERTAYDSIDFSGIPGISVAFRSETVTIYRVNQTQLAA
jgi:YYY domain-containing protein